MQLQGNPSNPQKPPIPEMVGATTAPFNIGPGPTQVSFEMHRPTGPAFNEEGVLPKQIYLTFENMRGKARAPSFRVYLNLPPGEPPEQHPELRAGNLGMFGLVESSSPRGNHGGDGKTMTLDVTSLFTRLMALRDWDSRILRVTFVPGSWDAAVPQVQVGRVALYFR
jgi:tyrosinase